MQSHKLVSLKVLIKTFNPKPLNQNFQTSPNLIYFWPFWRPCTVLKDPIWLTFDTWVKMRSNSIILVYCWKFFPFLKKMYMFFLNFSQFFGPCTALGILLWRNWRKGLLVRSKSIVFGCYWNCSSLIFFFFSIQFMFLVIMGQFWSFLAIFKAHIYWPWTCICFKFNLASKIYCRFTKK